MAGDLGLNILYAVPVTQNRGTYPLLFHTVYKILAIYDIKEWWVSPTPTLSNWQLLAEWKKKHNSKVEVSNVIYY